MGGNDERRGSGDRSIRWFGRHLVRIEEPDIYYIRFSGPVSGQELSDIVDYRMAWGADKKTYYVLTDLTDLGMVSAEARRVMGEGRAKVGVHVTNVIFGATFAVRVMIDMVNRALKALRPGQAKAVGMVVFVANEAEARAEIEKRRALR